MKQHNSFKNDMDLIAEAAMGVLGGAHMMHNVAGNAANALAHEDGFDALANVIDHFGQKHEDGEHSPESPEDGEYM